MDNIEINDLLKEYGIEPLKTQLQTNPNQSKQVINSQLYPFLGLRLKFSNFINFEN